MRLLVRAGVPTILFVLMSWFYVAQSGGPTRVHVLSIACLCLGFWLPAVLAVALPPGRLRLSLCSAAIVGAMVVWDGLSYRVVLKVEPFDILTSHPWVYPLGFICLGILVLVSTWLSGILGAAHANRS